MILLDSRLDGRVRKLFGAAPNSRPACLMNLDGRNRPGILWSAFQIDPLCAIMIAYGALR
jgi:hypothetical protein